MSEVEYTYKRYKEAAKKAQEANEKWEKAEGAKIWWEKREALEAELEEERTWNLYLETTGG